MSEITDIEIHNIRIGYLQTLLPYNVDIDTALKIADGYIANPFGSKNQVSITNPDLSHIQEQINLVKKSIGADVDERDLDIEQLGDILKMSKSEVGENRIKEVADALRDDSDSIEIKRPQKEGIKTPTQAVTPNFGEMVDPNKAKADEKMPDQGELEVSEELRENRTAGGTIPMRYEDRVKYAEQMNGPQAQQQVERPENAKIDGRGYGESGGDLPPGTK